MTPQIFNERLDELMQSALSENPVPLAHMIFKLETARAKAVGIWLQSDFEKSQRVIASKIISGNGTLPVRN